MGILESQVQRRVVAWATVHGILNIKLNGEGHPGWPDYVFWLAGGRPLLIEFKRPGGKPRPLQLLVHEQLRKRGYRVEVCDSATAGIRLLAEAMDAPQLPEASG